MKTRIHYAKAAPGVYEAMEGLGAYLDASPLERTLLLLVQLRASQVNGCAYCIDMHWKDLRAAGETEQRLYALDAWGESPFYGERELADLTLAVAAINAWNRLSIAARLTPGTCQPAAAA